MQQSGENLKAGVDLARVRAALAPVLAAHGVELVELDFLTERAGWTLRLTIERAAPKGPGGAPGVRVPGVEAADGGVTLEDCVEVSRDASSVLDVEDLIPQHYHLEVSSPGLDRPLRHLEDFARFQGRLAKVKLKRPAPDGQRLLRGTIEATSGDSIAMRVDGKRMEAPWADVEESRLVFELAASPKKSAPGRKKAAGERR